METAVHWVVVALELALREVAGRALDGTLASAEVWNAYWDRGTKMETVGGVATEVSLVDRALNGGKAIAASSRAPRLLLPRHLGRQRRKTR